MDKNPLLEQPIGKPSMAPGFLSQKTNCILLSANPRPCTCPPLYTAFFQSSPTIINSRDAKLHISVFFFSIFLLCLYKTVLETVPYLSHHSLDSTTQYLSLSICTSLCIYLYTFSLPYPVFLCFSLFVAVFGIFRAFGTCPDRSLKIFGILKSNAIVIFKGKFCFFFFFFPEGKDR